MSLQVFLHLQFRGIERFLAAAPDNTGFADRVLWVSLLGEIVPRAFLRSKGLSPLLVGCSAGGSSLLLLPEPVVPEAVKYAAAIRSRVLQATNGDVELHWAHTENLGAWPNIWKRLQEALRRSRMTPLRDSGLDAFRLAPDAALPAEDLAQAATPWQGLAAQIEKATTVGWNPEEGLQFLADGGSLNWQLGISPDGIIVVVPDAAPQNLASAAHGQPAWGLLRCDIDGAAARLNMAGSAEDFLYLAVLYQGLVAGELQRIAAMPNHAGRVSVMYSGGDDFVVAGAWDALLGVAIEFHRVFTLFAADLPGGREIAEGATVSAALSVAEPGETLSTLWRRNHDALETVKCSGRNAFALFGRILNWPDLKEAEMLKGRMRKLREGYRCPPEVFAELEDFYGVRGAGEHLASVKARRRERSFDRPWRFHSRLRRLAGDRSGSEFERQWRNLISDLLGQGQGLRQLRPAGKVALNWAQLEMGSRA
jgi:hypothetical protein